MTRVFRALVILLLPVLVACGESPPSTDPDSSTTTPPAGIAIQNVTVIDARYGVRANRTVIFDGDYISAVQPADTPINAEEVIDGTGKYLIPGLWDFHVHLTYDDRFTAVMPELFLSWGITSVRDTGGLMDKVLPVVEAMRAEDAVAPRVFFAGPLLDGDYVVYDGVDRPEIGIRVATTEDAERVVRELVEQGVNFIKVYEMLSPEAFNALVETARQVDLPIDSHVPLAMRAREAGPLVDAIEHLRNIELDCVADAETLHATRLQLLENSDGLSGGDLRSSLHALQRDAAVRNYDEKECDEVIAALSETTMVPTLRLNSFALLPSYARDDWEAALARTPESVQTPWLAQGQAAAAREAGDTTFADWSLFLTGRMHQAGVPLAAGTDTPILLSIPGYSLHEELEMLVRAGLSELDAIAAATLRPAQWFQLDGILGSIAVGKRADLVLLDANPLEDITNTKSIALVVSKGALVQ